jgi:serine/threonine protein kinase
MDSPAAPAPSDAEERHSLDALQEALGDDFEIKQKLGRGSVATVYLAREKALNRLVAVKVLLPGRARDETTRRRFEREARAAASLSHPNVVQVFRFGRLPDETPYLVMRFVKGRTLEDRLAAEGPLPADLAREVLLGVASALAAAHAQGIVHRDVRPANVLWDEERRQALLADFGIAALLATGGEEATRLTKTGRCSGIRATLARSSSSTRTSPSSPTCTPSASWATRSTRARARTRRRRTRSGSPRT